MTGKKKLNLGPLPEELDYSKYEETVTRWDRVVGAVLAGLILLALLVYLVLGILKPTSEIAQVEQELTVPLSAEPSTRTQESSESAVAEEPVSEVSEQVEEPLVQTHVQSEGSKLDLPEAEITEVSETMQDQATMVASNRNASVNILNPGIVQAILSNEHDDNGPGAPLPETLILPESGITKVMLFTDMQGLLGRTLYHDWYRNGERQARVKIPVNYKSQRSFSSKFINMQMTGEWQVKVVDGKGNAYIDVGFKVIRP